MNDTKSEVVSAIFGTPGYSTAVPLTADELEQIRGWTTELWLARIGELYPDKVESFREVGLENYHKLADTIDHDSIWPRAAREYPADVAEKFCGLPFLSRLKEVLGPCSISDWEDSGFADFTWRLCRPNAENDVGPLHTDGSFWRIDGRENPPGHVRVKCWIALYNEPGLSGLSVVPDSHKQRHPYRAETRHGRSKPILELKNGSPETFLAPLEAGGTILFHDGLLHGGVVGRGVATRVSVEFTLFVKREVAEPFVSPGCPIQVDYDPIADEIG